MRANLNVELDEEALAILNKTAETSGVDRGALVSRAIKAMELLHTQRAAAVKVSIVESEAGLLIPMEDVFDDLDRLIDSYDQKHAA
jgi:predicted transcriptional regulator